MEEPALQVSKPKKHKNEIKDETQVEQLLNNINSPEDLKSLNLQQMELLSNEIREFLIENISKSGGHLASNLGVVELTLALHSVFSTPQDKIIWDVGHQSYVHKIITGRREAFKTIRSFHGISGFPKCLESSHDCFNTGHSSTSVSAALGMAKARDIKKEDYSVLAVIGDGALTGGMSFEALNDAGRSPNNFIVILNDNQMSIGKNVGGLSGYLNKIRTEPVYFKVKEDIDIILNKIPAIGKTAAKALSRVKGSIKYMIVPGVLFEELGFKYFGPVDGHNIAALTQVLSRAKTMKGPVLIHVMTQKGKGYSHAEKSPHLFHGISPFGIETGEVLSNKGPSFSDVFGNEMLKIAEEDQKVVAITAAMPHGTGLIEFSSRFQERFFDVGIAEQHAVTFAAGMAMNGLKPVFAVYSSFLQRSYDQLLHDVAIQNLHVVFAIDRAGIVGEDGETHQGIFDLSYLSHIPNMAVMSPCDYTEFADMIRYAVLGHKGPIAVRYPRGTGRERLYENYSPVENGKGLLIRQGSDLTIVSVGNMVETSLKLAFMLQKLGYSSDVINARFIKPIDEKLIAESVTKTKKLVTIEDNVVAGGFGSSVLQILNQKGINVKTRLFGFPDKFVRQGSRNELFEMYGLTPETLLHKVLKMFRN